MHVDLGGKVVLVTGAGRGIGAAAARALAAAGAHVVVHDVVSDRHVAALVEEIGPQRSTFVQADFAEPRSALALWERAVAWRDRVDVVVNNAGIYEKARITDPFDAWEASWIRTLNVNLFAAAHLCREAVRHFQAHGGGTIINIASRAGFRGDGPEYSHYAASKGAMLALTRTIARGFAAEGILAFAVAPGFVRTQLNDEFFREHGEAGALRETPLGSIAMPEDIANVIVFLASPLARHATGATIDVNGASYVR